MKSINQIKRKKLPSPHNCFFWPPAIPKGIYGNQNGKAFILPNNAKLINKTLVINDDTPCMILAFDAGGHNIEEAVSFSSFSREDVQSILLEHSGIEGQIKEINFPVSIASVVGLKDGDIIGDWKILLCNDKLLTPINDLSEIGKRINDPIKSSLNPRKRLYYRFIAGGKLCLAHSLILSLPLIIVNWHALIPTLILSAIAGLLLILLWDVYPGKNIVKGFLQALFLLIILWLNRIVFTTLLETNIFWSGLILIGSSIWLSYTFLGIKWNTR